MDSEETILEGIIGTVYTDEGTTPMATGPTVRVKVNGAGDYSATAMAPAPTLSQALQSPQAISSQFISIPMAEARPISSL